MSRQHISEHHDGAQPDPLGKTIASDTVCSRGPQVSCNNCRQSSVCLPISLRIEEIEKLNRIVRRSRPLRKGDCLYRVGQPFDSVYAVREGSVKTINIMDDGEERVTGFFLSGELVGVDGVGSNHYTHSAVTLESTNICEISFARLEEFSRKNPSLQRHLFQLLSRGIADEQQLIALRHISNAAKKVASLLLSISIRQSRRRMSATAFRLPMSRNDIGNYLGVAGKTVSRVLGRFQQRNILKVQGKEIVIVNMDRLGRIAHTDGF